MYIYIYIYSLISCICMYVCGAGQSSAPRQAAGVIRAGKSDESSSRRGMCNDTVQGLGFRVKDSSVCW